MKRRKLAVILGVALASGGAAVLPVTVSPVQAAPYYSSNSSAAVQLNGQPLATSIPPVVQNGRTLVPMRDIFEALGASVVYNAGDRSIEATKADTRVWLQIGNKAARVDDRQVWLDEAPSVIDGSTLVPLRFVSEALGAQVAWDGQRRIVDISSAAEEASGEQVAGMITVPKNAVVPVTTESEITSQTARAGDEFWVKVKSEHVGDSEFPPGTRLKGVVTEVTPKTKDQSGAVSVKFTGMELPNGHRQSIRGSLISLDKEDVDQSKRGRIVAKDKTKSGVNATTVLIGTGAGYVLGHVLLDQNSVLSAAVGALGGYLFGKHQGDKVVPQEAVVPAGTELGVRLDRSVNYEDNYGYETSREPYLQ